MKNFISFLMAFTLLTGITAPLLSADDHTREEVGSLLASTKKKLEEIKAGDVKEYAQQDIVTIEMYVKSAEKFLEDGKIEIAYYEITLGKAYFKLIEARKTLFDAQRDLDDTKKKLSEESSKKD